MYNYIAVILLLVVPASGQILRGGAPSCFSNFHNFQCVPIDGGVVYAWAMHTGVSNCLTTPIPNDSSFTGSSAGTSSASTIGCGGSGTAATITTTGLNFAATTAIASISANNPSFPNGATLSTVFNPNSVATIQVCGIVNTNAITNNIFQYGQVITRTNTGDFEIFNQNGAGTGQLFDSAGSQITAGAWNGTVARYISASGGSAKLWNNNSPRAGTWTTGTGNNAVPASAQAETDIGNLHQFTNALACVGTIGYQIAHDHAINIAAEPFIYWAFYRAMQFRNIAIVTP